MGSLGRIAQYSCLCHRSDRAVLPDATVVPSWLRRPGYTLLAVRLTAVAGYDPSRADCDHGPVSTRSRREVTLRRVRLVVTPPSLQQVASTAQSCECPAHAEPGTETVTAAAVDSTSASRVARVLVVAQRSQHYTRPDAVAALGVVDHRRRGRDRVRGLSERPLLTACRRVHCVQRSREVPIITHLSSDVDGAIRYRRRGKDPSGGPGEYPFSLACRRIHGIQRLVPTPNVDGPIDTVGDE